MDTTGDGWTKANEYSRNDRMKRALYVDDLPLPDPEDPEKLFDRFIQLYVKLGWEEQKLR